MKQQWSTKADSFEATAMAFNKMRMSISGIDMDAHILLSVELSTPFVTPSQFR